MQLREKGLMTLMRRSPIIFPDFYAKLGLTFDITMLDLMTTCGFEMLLRSITDTIQGRSTSRRHTELRAEAGFQADRNFDSHFSGLLRDMSSNASRVGIPIMCMRISWLRPYEPDRLEVDLSDAPAILNEGEGIQIVKAVPPHIRQQLRKFYPADP
jgi:hypothetical protein